jgi:hypothetical protein
LADVHDGVHLGLHTLPNGQHNFLNDHLLFWMAFMP